MLQAFQAPGRWLKGNLHAHTTNSDGRVAPDERVAGFARQGYDFLAITDHNFVTRGASDDLVLISGAEYVIRLDYRSYHLVALNVPAGFQLFDGLAMQESVDEVRSAGALPIIAHPYWCGLTAAELRDVRGCLGIEVFNTTCLLGNGKGVSAVHWDDLLCAGWRGFGFAVDDCHRTADAYGGWIMVKSLDREAGAIVQAIKAGRFYASTGPEIKSVVLEGSRLTVECSPAAVVNFIGRAAAGRQIAAPEGETMTSASFDLASEFGYVRIEVVDSRGRTAWTNPHYLT